MFGLPVTYPLDQHASVSYPGVVTNPPMPYLGNIGHSLQDGEMLIIQGYVPPYAKSFSINLKCGPHEHSPNALHINPRFEGTNQIVRNSFRNGAWESEERGGQFPLQHSQSFEMILMIERDCYKIAFNGKHFAEFRHRMQKEMVNTITIIGDVNIQSLRFQLPPQQPGFGFGGVSPPAYNLQVPYTSSIPGSMSPGRMIIISAVPLATADRFNIDLVQGSKNVIAFHFNPRMMEGTVVRNHSMGGVWGPEERSQPYFPFQANMAFDLIIMCDQTQFKVAVNNKHFIAFSHRVHDLHNINIMNIGGGIRLTNVRFQ